MRYIEFLGGKLCDTLILNHKDTTWSLNIDPDTLSIEYDNRNGLDIHIEKIYLQSSDNVEMFYNNKFFIVKPIVYRSELKLSIYHHLQNIISAFSPTDNTTLNINEFILNGTTRI